VNDDIERRRRLLAKHKRYYDKHRRKRKNQRNPQRATHEPPSNCAWCGIPVVRRRYPCGRLENYQRFLHDRRYCAEHKYFGQQASNRRKSEAAARRRKTPDHAEILQRYATAVRFFQKMWSGAYYEHAEDFGSWCVEQWLRGVSTETLFKHLASRFVRMEIPYSGSTKGRRQDGLFYSNFSGEFVDGIGDQEDECLTPYETR
jgi:hypothetical protein